MQARVNDMPQEKEYYIFEHRLSELEKTVDRHERQNSDSYAQLSKAVKTLSDSFIRFEASIKSIAAFSKWLIPLLISNMIAVLFFILKG